MSVSTRPNSSATGWPCEFVDRLLQGVEERRAGLHQQRQQVEQERHPPLDLRAAGTCLATASRRRRNQAVSGHGQRRRQQPAGAEPIEEHVDVQRREKQGDQFEPGQVLFGQPEPRQPGRLNLALDLRQALAKHGPIDAANSWITGWNTR